VLDDAHVAAGLAKRARDRAVKGFDLAMLVEQEIALLRRVGDRRDIRA
jgi:hypothetical protein